MTGEWFFFLIVTGLAASFFFSGTETGILATDTMDLHRLSKAGSKNAAALLKMLKRKDLILAALLVGNNITNVTVSVMTTAYFYNTFGSHAPAMTVVIITPLILFFGEILPKTLYLANGNRFLVRTYWLIRLTALVFHPFAAAAVALPRLITSPHRTRTQDLTRQDIHILVKTGAGAHQISQEERTMMDRLLDMKDRRVIKAMKPIGDVIMIPSDATVHDALRQIRRYGVSRLPVYRDTHDNITGIVVAVDLLKAANPADPVAPFVRKPFFVPEQTIIIHLLEDAYKEHEFAIVIDEYGVAAGIITMEDMIEEITGDIMDEYDREIPVAYKLKRGTHIVDSRISIKEFNESVAPILPPGDYLTLAGFLSTAMQKIPQAGAIFEYENARFVVLDATAKRLGRIIVHIDPGKSETGDDRHS
jgi:putative hemolysin